MSGDFESAVRTSDIFVSTGYEYRLPHSQMFSWTALLPIGDSESYCFERPGCLFLPARDIVRFLLTVLMVVGSLSFLGKCGQCLVVSVNDPSASSAVDHSRSREGSSRGEYQTTVTLVESQNSASSRNLNASNSPSA